MSPLSRRGFLSVCSAGSLAGIVGCQGTPTIFGYQLGTDALYDTSIKSVFVRTFYNRTLLTGPFRGEEVRCTEEVVRQIAQKTPFTIADIKTADTELIGKIVMVSKNEFNVTQQNQIREGEVVLTVDVVWRDLRTGKILSAPRKKRNTGAAPGGAPIEPFDLPPERFDPNVPLPPVEAKTPEAEPVRIVASGRYLPEFGESIASALQKAEINLATQITHMMEKPWGGSRTAAP